MATVNTIGKLQYAPASKGNVKAESANPLKRKAGDASGAILFIPGWIS